MESYENLLRNPLVSATSLDDYLLIFNFMALGIFLYFSLSSFMLSFPAPVVSNGNSEFLSKNSDHGMELLTFDDIDSPVVPVGESIHRLQFPALKNSGDLCFIVQTLDVLPVYDVYIVKDNHLEHILEKKTSEVFTTDVLSALLERWEVN